MFPLFFSMEFKKKWIVKNAWIEKRLFFWTGSHDIVVIKCCSLPLFMDVFLKKSYYFFIQS